MSIHNIKNKKHIFLSLASLVVFSGLIFGGGLFNRGKFPITWTSDRIEQTQFIGTSQVANATFKSAKELENVKFWLTPRLSKYAKVEPETIAKVEKDKEYNISIIVFIPTDFKTRKLPGYEIEKNDLDNLRKFSEEDSDNLFKEYETFLKDITSGKIHGLIFVKSEKDLPWSKKLFKEKGRKIEIIHPLPLRIVLNVKEPTAAEIPIDQVSLPIPERIYEDTQTGAVYVKDEIIIGFEEGTSQERIKEIVSAINGTFLGSVPDLGMYQIQVSVLSPSELQTIIQRLEFYPEVGIATYSWIDRAF